MTTPRGEASESADPAATRGGASEPVDPAEIRETGIGWPGAPAPSRSRPAWDSPRSAQPRPPSSRPSGSGSTATGGGQRSRPGSAAPGAPHRPTAGSTGPSRSSSSSATTSRSGSGFDRAVENYRSRQPRSRLPELPPERPGTVTAAAVILWVGAGLGLLACCGITFLGDQTQLSDSEQTFLTIFAVIAVVVSLFNAILGYHIWEGRQWARVTTIVFCAIGIAGQIINVLASGGAAADAGIGVCLGIALNVLVIGLLSGSQASEYFQHYRRR